MKSRPPGGPLWPEHWAVQAALDADRIDHRLSIATAGELTAAQREAKAAVEDHLAEARSACRPTGRRKRRGFRDKWRGTSVERAYLHLHAAKMFLVDVLPEAEFNAIIPEVSTRLGMTLDRNDPRRVEGERMLHTGTGEIRRAAVKQAMETAYDASDEEYVRLRDFRNILVMAAAAIAVLTGLLIGLVVQSPQAIPLCFEPSVTAAAAPGQPPAQDVQSVCPSGERQVPTGGDILIVAALGALGGALGALIAVRNLRGTSTPYSVSTALAVLKVPSGAMTTIIGMLLLAGGFIPGLSNLDSQEQILAYALLFGIAQQLVTRMADNRAQQILDNLPSKDPQAKPASPPVVVPPPQKPASDPPDDATDPASQEQAGAAAPAAPGGLPPAVPDAAEDAEPEGDDDPDDGADQDPAAAPSPTVDLNEPAEPVQATGEFLPAHEVEELTAEKFPLEPEESDDFPDDDGTPDIDDAEAAQTGTDKG
jgi:hypothetical protein